MAEFQDNEKSRINQQYTDILKNIPYSAPYNLRRAIENAAQELRDFRLDLHAKELSIKNKYDNELAHLKQQTADQHTKLISSLNQAKRAVASWQK